jgi:hypothetical protein
VYVHPFLTIQLYNKINLSLSLIEQLVTRENVEERCLHAFLTSTLDGRSYPANLPPGKQFLVPAFSYKEITELLFLWRYLDVLS